MDFTIQQCRICKFLENKKSKKSKKGNIIKLCANQIIIGLDNNINNNNNNDKSNKYRPINDNTTMILMILIIFLKNLAFQCSSNGVFQGVFE